MKKYSPVKKYFDSTAKKYDFYKTKSKFYYDNLKNLLSSLIPSGADVLEFGCGTGNLISFLKPKEGFGYDISPEMIKLALKKDNKIHFSTRLPKRKFNYIFMSDVIEHIENPGKEFLKIPKLMSKKSIFVCTMANPIWEPVLLIAEKFGLKMPEGPHFRPEYADIKELLKKSDLKIRKHDFFLLIPVYVPVITPLMNKHLEKYLKKYAFIEYFTATKL